MKINFDDIITKANARKDALVNFVSQIDALSELMDDVDALGERMASLNVACHALDDEAVKMVGLYKVTALRSLAARYAEFVRGLNYSSGTALPIIKVINKMIAEVAEGK